MPSSSPHGEKIVSYGIICLDLSVTPYRILCIQKSIRYAYHAIVKGAYSTNESLQSLINQTTFHEKNILNSGQFSMVWYNVYGEIAGDASIPVNNPRLYNKYKSKYLENLSRIKAAMANSTIGELLWEPPKGRRGQHEKDIDCAVREFREETSKPASDILVMSSIPPFVDNYSDEGVHYVTNYYLAVNIGSIDVRMTYNPVNREVSKLAWFSSENIALMSRCDSYKNRLQQLFKYCDKFEPTMRAAIIRHTAEHVPLSTAEIIERVIAQVKIKSC